MIPTDPSSDAATPTLENDATVEPLCACKHSLILILGIRKGRSGASARHAKANTFPVHGLTDKSGNKDANKKVGVDSDLMDFLKRYATK
jgi:hypothetical protein